MFLLRLVNMVVGVLRHDGTVRTLTFTLNNQSVCPPYVILVLCYIIFTKTLT